MKLLLTSAGITNDAIANGLQTLVGKPLTETKIVFIPTAANRGTEDKSWLIDNITELRDQNFKSLDMLDIAGLPVEIWLPHLENADVICFGGGDETYLSRILTEQHVEAQLRTLLQERVYMGISAGSMVAGISLPKGMSPALFGEDDYESDEGMGMKLCDFTFIPHLNSEYFSQVRTQTLDSYARKLPNTSYATDDYTALAVTDGQIAYIGDGQVWKLEK